MPFAAAQPVIAGPHQSETNGQGELQTLRAPRDVAPDGHEEREIDPPWSCQELDLFHPVIVS